ncbi:MAG: septum formation initiator family protein, partial [Pseudomonadota bacterium]
FGDRGVKDLYSLKTESKRLATAAEKLDQENQRVYRNIERLRTDLEYIEDIARQELGMVKSGETVFQFLKKEMKAKKNGLPNSNLGRP